MCGQRPEKSSRNSAAWSIISELVNRGAVPSGKITATGSKLVISSSNVSGNFGVKARTDPSAGGA